VLAKQASGPCSESAWSGYLCIWAKLGRSRSHAEENIEPSILKKNGEPKWLRDWLHDG